MLRPTLLGRRNTAAPFSAVLPGVPAPPVAALDVPAPELPSTTAVPASVLSVDDVRWGADPAPNLATTEAWAEPVPEGQDGAVAAGPQEAERAAPAPEASIRETPAAPMPDVPADRDDWFAGAQPAEDGEEPDETLWESEWNRWEESGRPESLQRETPAWSGTTDVAAAMAPEPTVPLPDRAAEVLEAVARMVRSREIVVSVNPGASTESVLASILASLLSHPS